MLCFGSNNNNNNNNKKVAKNVPIRKVVLKNGMYLVNAFLNDCSTTSACNWNMFCRT